MHQISDFVLNLDDNLQKAVEHYGLWIYLIGCIIVFCETGLIIFAVLPGDTLLFAAASLAAVNILDPALTLTLFPLAAFLGDQANYALGKLFGKRLFRQKKIPFFNEQNLKKAERFYTKHGPRAVIIGRFIPVVRSLSPFVAAVSDMPYARTFVWFSFIGATAWAYLFLLLGYFFGRIPFVKDNLWLIITAVAVLAFVPVIISYIRGRREGATSENHQSTA